MPAERSPMFVAQQAVSPVAKDARNEFQNFDYASAEAVIQAARAALADGGICVARLGYDLEIQEGYWVLCSTYLITGDPSYSAPFVRKFPLVPGKGRPLDKSLAVALTSDLAYTLRDLLLIPRIGVDESIDARNDAESGSGRKAKINERVEQLRKNIHDATAGASASASSMIMKDPTGENREAITPSSYKTVDSLLKETQTNRRLFLEYFKVSELADLTEQEAQQATLILLKKKGG